MGRKKRLTRFFGVGAISLVKVPHSSTGVDVGFAKAAIIRR